ncbi:hypothetical protein [Halobacteriovorax marinus]|uniref:hypothetical protein n=1 Tax=Halobacteriovorax marinus TaxID=97084 RepID=UPI003A8D5F44
MEKLRRSKYLYICFGVHILPILVMYFITCFYLQYVKFWEYSIFTFAFSLPLLSSLYEVVEKRRGYFYYLLSILFFLGFVGKFSMHEIFRYDYVEPIGFFKFSRESVSEVLLIGVVGAVGFFLSEMASKKLFRSREVSRLEDRKNNVDWRGRVLFLFITAVLALVNLKYNVLLFGVVPSIQLPLYGNIIFFLILTRGMGFIYSFHYLNKLSIIDIAIGSMIMLLASVGVLSRMFIVVYFLVVFIVFLSNVRGGSYRKKVKGIIVTFISFLLLSSFTVLVSSQLRQESTATSNSLFIRSVEIVRNLDRSDIRNMMSSYIKLAVDRWIGMEGLMAAASYPNKSPRLLIEGLLEKSYKGNSFYTKVSSPNLGKKNIAANLKISTSVPGPIAFLYYSGSLLIVFLGMFLVPLGLYTMLYYSSNFAALGTFSSAYISSFIAFDFFQFGISPRSFVAYTVFTIVCMIIYMGLYSKFYKNGDTSAKHS